MKKSNKEQKKRTCHIVSHTHWDREWRYPIWETRLMLTDFMDELIEVLESGKYPGFLLDGQVSPVLDYLEVRPEMTPRVKALVKSGKLEIGPWLVLPDEYPVDGESLVRSLLLGTRRAKELGGCFKAGYTPFGWGQTAQLVQIYAGFDMDIAMIGKRVNKQRAPQCEFIWRGLDGSELLSTRFGEWGRQNFYFKIHLTSLFGIYHEGQDWLYAWEKGGIAYHRADAEQAEQDHFRLDAPQNWYPQTITKELMEEVWHTMDESVMEDDRLMMNGCDYTASQPMFPEMVERLNELDAGTDRRWVHTTMTQFVRLMRQKIDRSKLAVVDGELRDGPAAAITGNALTTRLYLKQKNKYAQNMLIRFAEPLAALAAMAGAEYQKELFKKAWEFLLASHPHDSINGVTQDKTVLDVCNRLDQVIDISQSLGNRAMQELVKKIDMSKFEENDVLIVAFNPSPYPRREIIEAYINFPNDMPRNKLWGRDKEWAQMFDADSKPVDTQSEGYTEQAYPVAEIHTRAFPYYCLRHKLFFDTGNIPAGGYKIFKAVKKSCDLNGQSKVWGHPFARTGTLLKAPNIIENEFLKIEMNCNGTFNLTDKQLGRAFQNLNYYQDRGEHGDYWVNCPPMFNEVHNSLGCQARIWSEESGPLQATLVSEITMKLPQKGVEEKQRRGEKIADLTILTKVTLRAGERQVEVNVEFENHHEDHYLRAMFPTGIAKAAYADTGGHFTVDRRSILPQGPDKKSVWPDMGTQPHINFVDVSDGKVGLAFINDCLTEYEVLDNNERTLALSLLRAVKCWICTDIRVGATYPSQKGGQCLGRHKLRYAICPHTGNWQQANIPLIAEQFNSPVRLVQTREHEGSLPVGGVSLFSVDNPMLRFSAIKKAEQGNSFIIRLYNPTNELQKGSISFAFSVAQAWQTNLDEKRLNKLNITKNNKVSFIAEPNKIITLEVKNK